MITGRPHTLETAEGQYKTSPPFIFDVSDKRLRFLDMKGVHLDSGERSCSEGVPSPKAKLCRLASL
jgi:hypothetical protein